MIQIGQLIGCTNIQSKAGSSKNNYTNSFRVRDYFESPNEA